MNDTDRTYDVVVIGAGPVGENVAERTRAAGLSTVIVERELLGGECSYWACEPSKALLRPVLGRADALRVPGLRRAVDRPLDVAAVLAHRDDIVQHWRDDDQVEWLESVSVDLVRGHGRLDGPRQVVVSTPDGGTVRLSTRHDIAGVAGAFQYAKGYRGKARTLVDTDCGTVAGVTFVGPGVAELLHSATITVTSEVPIERLWHAVPAFPTISEVWLRLLESYRG
ncbi:FAD-dependent oxidoreductase [Streptomyces sp. NPDC002205]|uniref:FAD-dependent oxidoreductase n=1 Tax=Streptomyces sp. NPDC002205 TaxID=3154411 RepID=UPI00333165A3